MHVILAEKSVSLTDLRKNPAQYFIDEPVAVLSNNKPAGYMVSAAVFEQLLKAAEQQGVQTFRARFRPEATRLKEIAEQGASLLKSASDEDLEFVE
ncbi:MAG: type I toxin-antitoxin system antitoxin YafN [Marinospirillum sp.]|uniref:type I toxin-antitoxin system antitoxin YafN n=1 Tax=Marinospirillum sp. TaxID=2183934 RepID=UPI0019ECB8F6|nr:type I toxin-antitoxin system antitoxin YafN [Marinospirillum sp.]MBE0508584.1 type I toxin-antitoxin system antitoxin YafN [Marinospirillum sp.]